MIGIGKAAENGILIRSGEALERARSVDTVILDKTGTITVGSPAVAEVRPLPDTTVDELLEIAGRVEVGSEHPVGRAIVDSATAARGKLGSVTDFVAVPGLGVRARVEDRVAWVGSVEFLTREGVDCQNVEELVGDVGARAQTPVVVAWDGRARGVIGVADPVKPDSLEAIDRLRSSGKRVIMITGDHPATARAVADELGVSEVLARVLPGEKAAKVSALQAEGRVIAMVGDGVNDAPALAQADVGIAIGTGTDVAFEAADLTLMGGSLGGVVRALEVSDATFRNIRQNLVGAFVYNVIGIPVAAGALYPAFGILLSPVIAGAAMAFSSVTVVTNANRLRNFRPTAIG
jgi:Cu+-exporting ATPase